MNNSSSGLPSQSGQALPPFRAFLILVGIVVLLAGYICLCYLFKIEAIFAGSLFVFFWVGVEKTAPTAFTPTIVGAVGGIANAGLLHASLMTALGINPGLAALAGLGLLMLAIFMLLIKRASVLFNHGYMLFVTVAAITQLSDTKIFISMVECVFLSAVYFGSLLWIIRRIGTERWLLGSR